MSRRRNDANIPAQVRRAGPREARVARARRHATGRRLQRRCVAQTAAQAAAMHECESVCGQTRAHRVRAQRQRTAAHCAEEVVGRARRTEESNLAAPQCALGCGIPIVRPFAGGRPHTVSRQHGPSVLCSLECCEAATDCSDPTTSTPGQRRKSSATRGHIKKDVSWQTGCKGIYGCRERAAGAGEVLRARGVAGHSRVGCYLWSSILERAGGSVAVDVLLVHVHRRAGRQLPFVGIRADLCSSVLHDAGRVAFLVTSDDCCGGGERIHVAPRACGWPRRGPPRLWTQFAA